MEDQVIRERYELSMDRIRRFMEEETVKEPYRDFFREMSRFTGRCKMVMDAVLDGSFGSWDREKLIWINEALYEDVAGENYERSYGNPSYAVSVLGEALGKLLSFLYTEIRGDIVYAFEGRLLDMVIGNEALIEIYNLFEEEGIPSEKSVHDVLYWCVSDYCDVTLTYRIRESVDPSLDFAKKIIMEQDLSDLSYLYRFGEYVSERELAVAGFLNRLPEDTIRKMAETFTEGYIRGFSVMGRDLSRKKTVSIRYPLGFERVVREAVKIFESRGLSVIFTRGAVSSVCKSPSGRGGYASSSPNKQYDYDWRYNSAVYFDKAFRDRKLSILKTAYEQYKKEAAGYGGPAVIEVFGEEGFTPVNKKEAWTFSEKQQKLYLEYRNMSMPVTNQYIPGDETSFTIIAFPVPDIGPDFEEIFAETIKINTLDSEKYQKIQQTLIEVLDKAEYVEILGKGHNCTNMRVNLMELLDPASQTRFENCVADVNIPVGEVFTSPRLEGTNGILNVGCVYIRGIQFKNLTMEFREGRVISASCDNFVESLPDFCSPKERKKAISDGHDLVVQVIMNQHEDLPLGEFAIGTNTTAYAMAEKFHILDRLPILIVEKMGPHFAVGDTCYSWSEDSPMYNPDGKEMVARDNEISILRKEDVSKAYFGVHTDITIPYKELERISAVAPDGTKTSIIEDGRFSLPGLEELNKALDSDGSEVI